MGNVKKTVGLVCLGALCVLMIVLGVRTAGYVQLTREEAATTPTEMCWSLRRILMRLPQSLC